MHTKNVYKVSFSADDYHVWHDLLKVKNLYLMGRQVITKSGDKTRFQKDCWLDNQPLCRINPELYDICDCKDIMVKNVMEANIQISFMRLLHDDIGMKAKNFNYQSVSDIIIWKWEKTRMFIKSMYSQLIKTDLGPHLKHIWKSKIPPKIKIIMWFLENNVLLIKDNFISRRWIGDAYCFCDQEEYVDHHFFFQMFYFQSNLGNSGILCEH